MEKSASIFYAIKNFFMKNSVSKNTDFTPKTQREYPNSVGQLAKSGCPTDKQLSDSDLTVGRQDEHYARAYTHVRLPAHVVKQLKEEVIKHQKIKKNPESLQAQRHAEQIRNFTNLTKMVYPDVKAYFGKHSYLPAVKEVFLPLQFKLFKQLVQAFAILHHKQRPRFKSGVLVESSDYYCALQVLRHKMPRKRVKILHRGRYNLLVFLNAHYQNQERFFTVGSLHYDTDYSHSYLKELLRQLAREGIIEGHREKRNQYIRYRLIKPNFGLETS